MVLEVSEAYNCCSLETCISVAPVCWRMAYTSARRMHSALILSSCGYDSMWMVAPTTAAAVIVLISGEV